jgi:prophage antirepressor-like protein
MSNIKLFEDKRIRTHYIEDEEMWYFSVTDVIEILTGSTIPKRYWSDLKKKLTKEGSQLYDKIVQLKFEASDGKKYATDCLSTEDLLRLIQSIPSPKAEPFKLWLAQTGYERIEEIQDPEKSIDRAMENYMKLGYSRECLPDWSFRRGLISD